MPRIKEGEKLPFFRYDTPYSAQERSRALLGRHPPLVLVFMSNFGHPVTRTFAGRYADTAAALTDGSFAMVVRSAPEKLAGTIGPDTLPYPLLCDAEGTLYDLLDIPRRTGTLTTCSLEGWRILREARRQGYREPKGAQQQLPLTLILDADGTVLFVHYGDSLTDVPRDCAAMQQLLAALGLTRPAPEPLPEPEPLPPPPAGPQDLFAEPAPDAARVRLHDPVDTLTQGLPLEDLAPELPGYVSDSGQFILPPDTFDPRTYTPRAPLAPLAGEEPPRPIPRRHRPATRRYGAPPPKP